VSAADDTRSGRQEQVRFAWAVLFSLSLHASLLILHAGPRPGRPTTATVAGGVIEAHLQRAAPDPGPPPVFPAPVLTQPPVPELPLNLIVAVSGRPSPEPAPAPPAATAAAASSSSTPPGRFEREGLGPVAGTATAGDNPFTIPSLPPLPPQRSVLRRPSLLAPVRFPYPPNTRVQGGRVRVRILLDDKGNVEEMRVIQAAPPGVFDSAALSVLRSARYAPGFVGPNALRSYLFMEVTFGPGPQGQQLWYAGDARAPAKGEQ
jgi:protein TonB